MNRYILTFDAADGYFSAGPISFIGRGKSLEDAIASLKAEAWYVFDTGYALCSVAVL